MATPAPVLDLTTPSAQVRIDGQLYTLRVADDLTILQNADYATKFERADVLRLKLRKSPAEAAELAQILTDLCGVVLDAPPAVLRKLSVMQRLGVVNSFFQQVASGSNAPLPTPRAVGTKTPTRRGR